MSQNSNHSKSKLTRRQFLIYSSAAASAAAAVVLKTDAHEDTKTSLTIIDGSHTIYGYAG